jgi:isoleucyl-tRNA synthetase
MNFCSEDLGAFYLDILKDRLYTAAENSRARRSAQSALWHILQTVTRLMAPVLSFTAEEIWTTIGTKCEQGDSVMLSTWHVLPEQAGEPALAKRWQAIRALRADVARTLEELRSAGKIGSSLQAEVSLRADPASYDLLASLGDDLKFVLICSKVTLGKLGAGETAGGVSIEAVASSHAKCARCWHWREDVGQNTEHPELCGRCTSNLFGAGEAREIA